MLFRSAPGAVAWLMAFPWSYRASGICRCCLDSVSDNTVCITELEVSGINEVDEKNILLGVSLALREKLRILSVVRLGRRLWVWKAKAQWMF